MTLPQYALVAGVLFSLAIPGPASAAFVHKPPQTYSTNHGTVTTALMSAGECTRMGGRIVTNISCYSGKQCRGVMNQDCIDAAKAK